MLPMKLRQNGRQFPDGIFEYIFLNEKFSISNKTSSKYVPDGLIDNKPALVLIMVRHRKGEKPLTGPLIAQFTDSNVRHSASVS